MRNFQNPFEIYNQSFISAFSVCMTVPLIKLHTQFGDTSSNNLKSLLKNAGYIDKNVYKMVDKISNNCDVCKKYKVPPKPVVGLPTAADFNQSVALDLHYIDKNYGIFT